MNRIGFIVELRTVKAHSGEIKVETKEGEGREFVLKLPII
jgi:signal transduction histidine kinase